MCTISYNVKHLFIVHRMYLCILFFTEEGDYVTQNHSRLGLYKVYTSRIWSHASEASAVTFSIRIPIKLYSSCNLEYDINNELGPDQTYFDSISFVQIITACQLNSELLITHLIISFYVTWLQTHISKIALYEYDKYVLQKRINSSGKTAGPVVRFCEHWDQYTDSLRQKNSLNKRVPKIFIYMSKLVIIFLFKISVISLMSFFLNAKRSLSNAQHTYSLQTVHNSTGFFLLSHATIMYAIHWCS
jgi:hypothetical protein